MNARALTGIVVLSSLIACSESSDSDESATSTRVQLESCRDAWAALTPLSDLPGDAPSKVQWHEGALYYVHTTIPSRFESVPDSGGQRAEISRDVGNPFWIEDQSIIHARWDRLFSVPLTGGANTLVSDGQKFGPEAPRENVAFMYQQLDASHMYWVMHRYAEPEWSVWRMPRDGGVSEQIGALPDDVEFPAALVLSEERLLVAGADGDAYTLSVNGGNVETLPPAATTRERVLWTRFLGAADGGVLWAIGKMKSPNAKRLSYDVMIERPDGETDDAWPSMPSSFLPDHAWPDAGGGWIVTGLEPFADGEYHTSVWRIDARAKAKRLACDERIEIASGYATAAEVTEDAAYFVVQYLHEDPSLPDAKSRGMGWKLVKVEL